MRRAWCLLGSQRVSWEPGSGSTTMVEPQIFFAQRVNFPRPRHRVLRSNEQWSTFVDDTGSRSAIGEFVQVRCGHSLGLDLAAAPPSHRSAEEDDALVSRVVAEAATVASVCDAPSNNVRQQRRAVGKLATTTLASCWGAKVPTSVNGGVTLCPKRMTPFGVFARHGDTANGVTHPLSCLMNVSGATFLAYRGVALSDSGNTAAATPSATAGTDALPGTDTPTTLLADSNGGTCNGHFGFVLAELLSCVSLNAHCRIPVNKHGAPWDGVPRSAPARKSRVDVVAFRFIGPRFTPFRLCAPTAAQLQAVFHDNQVPSVPMTLFAGSLSCPVADLGWDMRRASEVREAMATLRAVAAHVSSAPTYTDAAPAAAGMRLRRQRPEDSNPAQSLG